MKKVSIYDAAAGILAKLYKKDGTLKSLVMAETMTDKKFLYAIVCETLKFRLVLEEIIQKSGISKAEKKIGLELLTVLVYDQLFGKGVRTGKYKSLIAKHKSRLNAELAKVKIRRKCKNNIDLIPAHIRAAIVLPRYCRVNTLKTTIDAAIKHFQDQGFIQKTFEELMYLDSFPKKSFCQDKHLPEILILPPSSDLHKDELFLSGGIILQDKASCFPAFILNPPKNAVVMDGCAAPGNKTSHLSAIMENTGKIFAVDMDRKRLDTLDRLTEKAGCTNITSMNCSFLDIDPNEKKFSKVEYMLLDPSCSGSGIVGRMDHLTQDITLEEDEEIAVNSEEDRVASLAEFQQQVILHAMKFPNLKKIVYSTCSKHKEENEMVVQHVLAANKDFELVKGIFAGWTRRGEPLFDGCEDLIRTLPEEDKTIGFFVALFVKRG